MQKDETGGLDIGAGEAAALRKSVPSNLCAGCKHVSRYRSGAEGFTGLLLLILSPSDGDQDFKRGPILNFSTHDLLGDVPGRLVPLCKRGEQPLFADEPD